MATSFISVSSLSQEKRDFYNKINSWNYSQGTQLMEIFQVADLQQDGVLEFTIPGFETDAFTATVARVDYKDADNYTWSGEITGIPGGYFIYASNSGARGGIIQLKKNSYSLLPLGDSLGILIKNDVQKYNALQCGNASVTPAQSVDYCDEDENTCPAVIDAVLLWTPGALAWLDGLGNDFIKALYVAIGTESVNWAFEQSAIPNKRLRTRSHPDVFNFAFQMPPDITIDVNNLVADPTAGAIRNTYRADLVIMLSNQEYINVTPLGTTQTFGRVGGFGPDESTAFALVEVPFFILPRWTFAHEVGHLFGALHNRLENGGNDNTDQCSHAWRFLDGGETFRNTILAASGAINPGDAGGRILHYSNPDTLFNGGARVRKMMITHVISEIQDVRWLFIVRMLP